MSTAYHPQSDGQTEKVNQCLEAYLRGMVYDKQGRWANYLTLAEWWYNLNYHSAIKVSPFEALYGYPPPQLGLGSAPKSQVELVNDYLRDRQTTFAQLKVNLVKAQERMKRNEDKHRSERRFEVGSWVYLKLQPYRQISVAVVRNPKLSSKYYGPFEVVQKIGTVAYRLSLPPNSVMHPVFHVSQLKAKLGDNQVPSPMLPVLGPEVNSNLKPQLILARKMVKKGNAAAAQILIQWQNQSREDVTWEDYDRIARMFPDFIREDTNLFKGGGVQRNESDLGELRVAVGILEEEIGERDAGKKISKLGQMSLKRKRDCDWDPQLK